MTNTNSTKIFSRKVAILLSFGVGLLALSLSVFIQTRSSVVEAFSTPTSQSLVIADPQSGSNAAPSAAAGVGTPFVAPSRLIIPAIGVDANIQSVGLWWRDSSVMGIPTNFTDVGWYNGSALPGSVGSAVMDGHYDGADVKQAVFYSLGKLKIGDLVKVLNTNGATLTFKVVATKHYAYDVATDDIFTSNDGKAHLNLITCGGNWIKDQGIYSQRVVVFTELVTTAE